MPPTNPPSTARRPMSGREFDLGDHLNRKERAPSGQASKQLKQDRHSAFSQVWLGIGEAAPWHLLEHILQSVHAASSFSSPRIVNLENIPRRAPRGHKMRHQKRGLILFRKRITRKISPINQAVLYAG